MDFAIAAQLNGFLQEYEAKLEERQKAEKLKFRCKIEEKINACVKRDKSLLESLKKRRLQYPLSGAPLLPFHFIKFRDNSRYSPTSYDTDEDSEGLRVKFRLTVRRHSDSDEWNRWDPDDSDFDL